MHVLNMNQKQHAKSVSKDILPMGRFVMKLILTTKLNFAASIRVELYAKNVLTTISSKTMCV